MIGSFLSLASIAFSLFLTLTDAVALTNRHHHAHILIKRANADTEGPQQLPFPASDFTTSAAAVRNTFCGPEYNQPGQKVGDDLTVLYSYGGDQVPDRVNIYHSNSLGIVIAYMGTNGTNLISNLANSELPNVNPDTALGLPQGAQVVQGFQQMWSMSWGQVKEALHQAQSTYPNLPIFVTGHSQGGGTCLLGAMSIAKEFDRQSISKVIAYRVPRAGNMAWADAFDSVFNGRYTGVTNGRDWVSDVPPQAMGYQHPSGMVWINPASSDKWAFYPGQENTNLSDSRTDSHSPEMFQPNGQVFWDDHSGIYMHTTFGGGCPAQIGGY